MSLAPGARPKLGRLFRIQWEEVQRCHVLLYPEGMVRLNQSAGEVMKRCDGSRTADEIIADLERSFGAANLRDDVEAFLEIALKQGWVDTGA